MAHFLLVRPSEGARQLWHCRQGYPPELVAPLVQHRRRFGDLYDWGAETPGALLTASTLLNRVGLPAAAAALVAPDLVGDLLATLDGQIVRIDRSELVDMVGELLDRNASNLLGRMCGKGGRNGA